MSPILNDITLESWFHTIQHALIEHKKYSENHSKNTRSSAFHHLFLRKLSKLHISIHIPIKERFLYEIPIQMFKYKTLLLNTHQTNN